MFLAVLLTARLVQSLVNLIARAMGASCLRAASLAPLLLAGVVLCLITDRAVVRVLFGLADGAYAVPAAFFDLEGPPPAEPFRTNGKASVLDWGATGL